MPFGLYKAPGTFRRTMNVTFSSTGWKSVFVYYEDIVIISNTQEQHIKHVQIVLSLLSSANRTFKPKKCSFSTDTFDYLGHVMHPTLVKLAFRIPDTTRALKPSTIIAKFRFFLGLCCVFGRLVPNFAQVVTQINQFLMKDQPDIFLPLNSKELNVMKILKTALMTPLVLALPYSDGHLMLNTEA